jgi:hypothetical protein
VSESWHEVLIEVKSALIDRQTLVDEAQNLAWDMMTHAAEAHGLDMASDGFSNGFREINDRMLDCAKAYQHLHTIAAQTVGAMLQGNVAILTRGDVSSDTIRDSVQRMVGILFGTISVIYATGPTGWVPDEEWDELSEKEKRVQIRAMVCNIDDKETA